MNQLPLQRRIVRQTLPNLMLFAAPNLTYRTSRRSKVALKSNLIKFGSAHEWSGAWT